MPSRPGKAPPHAVLVNDFVHVFVDDQNLFFGALRKQRDFSFRVDFGELLSLVSRRSDGVARPVARAYIAGVIPDDDSFWEIARNQGFEVLRGYLGSGRRSKQDDAHLITQITKTVFTRPGPSTVVLVAGDADYVPPLMEAVGAGWRTEAAFHQEGFSAALVNWVHEIRTIHPADYQLLKPRRR